mmetsp:Transcript_23378/g.35434  ORF Transcript_23378/g.35434 Transcript_23378/m.35434 type:complete len:139 (+) Transcript_23378:508-924(+)
MDIQHPWVIQALTTSFLSLACYNDSFRTMMDPFYYNPTKFLLSTKMIVNEQPPPEPPSNGNAADDCWSLFMVDTNFITLRSDRICSTFILIMFLIPIRYCSFSIGYPGSLSGELDSLMMEPAHISLSVCFNKFWEIGE